MGYFAAFATPAYIHRVSYSETSAGWDGGWLVAALG